MKNETSILTRVREALHGTTVSHKTGLLVVKRGFFYSRRQTSEGFAAKICADLNAAQVRDYAVCGGGVLRFEIANAGRVDKPFKGGGSVSQNSHFWCYLRTASAADADARESLNTPSLNILNTFVATEAL